MKPTQAGLVFLYLFSTGVWVNAIWGSTSMKAWRMREAAQHAMKKFYRKSMV